MRIAVSCLWVALVFVAWTGSAPAQETSPVGVEQPILERSAEELADLANWVEIVKNPAVESNQRVFNARKLIQKDWPEATQAVLQLLNNDNGTCVCVPVCRAISQNGPPRSEFVDPLFALLGDPDAGVRSEASAALSRYDDPVVIERLRLVAGDRANQAELRTAAVDTISRLDDTRLGAEILMSLVGASDPQFAAAVYRGLTVVSGQELGPDDGAWRGWWENHRNLDDEEWLRRQNALLKEQLKARDLRIIKSEERLAAAVGKGFATVGEEEQNTLLEQYLADDLEVIRLLAIDIIQRRIGDGSMPPEGLAAVLRSRLTDPSPRVRKGVLNVFIHLRAGTDARAVVDLLTGEKDQSVRAAAITTLGHLGNFEANPVLLAELQRETNPPSCRVAAARALGRLNAGGNSASPDAGAIVTALISEYERAAQQPELQVGLVQALAAIADPAVSTILQANLQHNQADVRLRCILGLRQIDGKLYLERILPLLSDPDVAVRREAASSTGQFGSNETHLAALMSRLRPEVETDASVRDVAWQSFVKIWSVQSTALQLNWARKLTEFPSRQIELLRTLEAQSSPAQASPDLIEIRTTLGTQYDALLRFGEAARYWGLLAEAMEQSGDPTWRSIALKRFRDLLLAAQYDEAVTEGLRILGPNSEMFRDELRSVVLEVLSSEKSARRDDSVARLLDLVRNRLNALMTADFEGRLLQFEIKQTSTDGGQQPSSRRTTDGLIIAAADSG